MRVICCAIGLLLLLPAFGMQIIVDNFPTPARRRWRRRDCAGR